MNERWKMNRIGFLNFWLYDEEIFDFENGKLLLRGQNGSGKSITTQSFIPFILDGDRTPSRLDPFGSSDRRMEYYFLGEEGKEESTGYLFLEFVKENTNENKKEYRTIGIGQRARRGKAMDFWGFVLLDGRRIGYDLWLYREIGSNKIPLTKAEMKKTLGETAPFTDVPGEYKGFVNKYIFGFRKLEQYEQFIKLLVKVRAPKLSKEFKPTKVYEILNESLQTLTDEDLRAMVDAMEKMDSIQESLEELTRAFADVRAIRTEYTRYNQYMLAKKGQAYLEKKKEVENGQKHLAQQEEEKLQMQEEQQGKAHRDDEIRYRTKVLDTELLSLYDTDMEDADRKLDQAYTDKKEMQGQLQKWENKIEEYKASIFQKEQTLRSLKDSLDENQTDLKESKEELNECQEILSLETHQEALRILDRQSTEGMEGMSQKLMEDKKRISEAKGTLEQYETAVKEYDACAEAFDQCQKEKLAKEQEEEAAQRELVDQQDELIAEIFKQSKENTEWNLEASVLAQLEEQLKHYQDPAVGDTIADLFYQNYIARNLGLREAQKDIERRKKEKEEQLADIEEEFERIQKSKDIEPDRDTLTEESRRAMQEAGIFGIPFFKTIEFAEELESAECARLEAQLEKMGILDALIVSEADFEKIKNEFPQLMDTLLHTEYPGSSSFRKLVVNENLDEELQNTVRRILSNIYENDTGQQGIYINADGTFRQGILVGKTDKSGEAQYVGRLARERRRQRMLAELEERKNQLQKDLEADIQEGLHLQERLEKLDEEYKNTPDCRRLNKILEKIRICTWNLEKISEQYQRQERLMQDCQDRKNQMYQKMLQSCKAFPYGRTVAEYQEVLETLEEYQKIWQELKGLLIRIEGNVSNIHMVEEAMEQAEAQLDDAFVEIRRYKAESEKQDVLIKQYEEYLNQPERKQQRERIEQLKKEKQDLAEERNQIGQRLAVLTDRIQKILDQEEEQKAQLRERIAEETCLSHYFEEELALKLVLDREGRSLADCAKAAQEELRDSDKAREAGELFNALFQVFQRHNGSLTSYGTKFENCFESNQDLYQETEQIQSLRSRVQIVSIWNGKKVYLEEFFQILKQAIEETELLIQKKDRELFEDILSQTISRQLTDRITESRKWVKDMSLLMKNMDTSMGLCFSLDWKPKTADSDVEMDTMELEQILLRDQALLTEEDISKVASHFRSKIRTEKMKQEERGGAVNYLDLVRDALDYRNWFEFQMYYRRGEETRRPLTNAAFNRFSGGEKAMAMYVPLFAAVNAQYQKAENEDHPRIIALDEAFAGVDDKNISSMFELVHILDFDYIMNSQSLWGCYENVPGLRIAELLRPANSQIVTVIRYTWNGHERVLDEQ